MNIIKDLYSTATIRLAQEGPDQTLVTIYEPERKVSIGLHAETDELLAALKAVDANKVLQDASDALDARRELEAKLAAVTAERDALAATVERVRELASRKVGSAAKELWAALDPKPAFVLPTEAGAGIKAERIDGPFKGETQELRLFSDGRWFNSTGHPAWPDDVMTEYTDHRLLEEKS